MNLYFSGHGEKYAVEQTMLTLFPQERPVYPEGPVQGDNALDLSFSRGPVWTTARAVLRRDGGTFTRQCRVKTARLDQADPVEATRLTRRTLQRAFYLAAVDCLGTEPPWGMLSGVRPVKLPTRAMEAGATPRQAEAMLRRDYRVSPARRRLAMDCAQASLAVKKSLQPQEVSLYVGIPFCPTRCAYCSFISSSGSANKLIPSYLEGLLREIDAAGENLQAAGKTVRSVYIGGGTPTTLSAPQLAQLMDRLRTAFRLAPDTEFTVEAGRPDTMTREKLEAIRAGGGNRISINPQTMSDGVLAAIGRSHRAEDIRAAYALAREVDVGAINMDLIAGLPGDTPEGFRASLEEVIGLDPENITVHTLALKRGARLRQEDAVIPEGEAVAQMLSFAWDALREAGYVPYYLYRQKFTSGSFENVGWCKPGTLSQYNICMMEELHTVLSLGAGGVTKTIGEGCVKRLANPKYPQEYLRDLDRIIEEKTTYF
ncbi:MAG: coproporphyrinogen dehydrogenase HemZ [Evtepia sp.]|uniref:coproporphyrinogen dehydrogenase HemZ n=1 Tax=Evtepia sp. TaxID=2773933 RepID=UPI002A74EF52|nr:coproporphyrinogen dehydrogenase HemZ [Evtepia sp.]MDY3015398.1 coproporphyrinogen dehydrogenase HemZ [Evtepia sp.]